MKVGEFSWLIKIFDYYEKVRLEEQGKKMYLTSIQEDDTITLRFLQKSNIGI